MRSEEHATLGGGCFWCIEAIFELVDGVHGVKSGYAGGHVPDPTYRQLCSDDTGHAEVVRVTFDPGVISYGEILEIFFAVHDPTTLNRQDADIGTRYRSVIFTHGETQQRTARNVRDRSAEEGLWNDPIVTEIEPLDVFYPAEQEHDAYFRRNGSQPYCQVVIAPKVAAFRSRFAHKLSSAT
jgi:peptide-methionine (S)-S-oxide reductase